MTFRTEYVFKSKRCPKCDSLITLDTVRRSFEGHVSKPKQIFKCVICDTVLEHTAKETVS